jgi:predicted DNA binding CopG/RHH family protein
VRIEVLIWNARNVEHIGRHGVHPDEVDEILRGGLSYREDAFGTLSFNGAFSRRPISGGNPGGAGGWKRIRDYGTRYDEDRKTEVFQTPMKKIKPVPKQIPHFASFEEEARFWDSHDLSSLMKKENLAHLEFARPLKHLISIRVDHSLLQGLRTMAARKHMPYQTLIHTILAEKLHEWHKKSA